MGLFLSPHSSISANVDQIQIEGPISPQSPLNSLKAGSTEQQRGSLSSFLLNKNTLNAMILWCFYAVKSHHTYRSSDSLKNLFKIMFPDSAIPEKFSIGKDKVTHDHLRNLPSIYVKVEKHD